MSQAHRFCVRIPVMSCLGWRGGGCCVCLACRRGRSVCEASFAVLEMFGRALYPFARRKCPGLKSCVLRVTRARVGVGGVLRKCMYQVGQNARINIWLIHIVFVVLFGVEFTCAMVCMVKRLLFLPVRGDSIPALKGAHMHLF